MKKICFTHAVDKTVASTQTFGVNYMPVWIYTLVSYLRDIPEIEIALFDCRIHSDSELPEADLYLFSGINQDYDAIVDFQRHAKLKYPRGLFAIGGPICWSFNAAGRIENLSDFDHIFIGDGEILLKDFIENGLIAKTKQFPKVIETKERFNLSSALPMDTKLLDQTLSKYYGAVVEVSRGCPFLCEFCDIRIQPDNNRAHVKSIEVIVAEIDYFARNGVTQILLACDNFIGDSPWANALCDAIIAWSKRTGLRANLYTWLTINLARMPQLLAKLREAGFDMFFIGIESFGQNQLLETAKIQNVKVELTESIQLIQSYGFIVVAGLIFGFDSDEEDCANTMLEGIRDSGLISGDPSLLTALPGTPLYKRMLYSNRLRDGKLGLGGFKYRTNIKYLKQTKDIIDTFSIFVSTFSQGPFQLERLERFFKSLDPAKFQYTKKSTYISPVKILKLIWRNPNAMMSVAKRFFMLFRNPSRSYAIAKAFIMTKRYGKHLDRNLVPYFNFWLFNWSNTVIKYSDITDADFDIGTVDSTFDITTDLVPKKYLEERDEPIPASKIESQRNLTLNSLKALIESRRERVS